SGPRTRSVQPEVGRMVPSRYTIDSNARVTVVPTASTRLPRFLAAVTPSAVRGGTLNHSGMGGSCRSGEETPACSVMGRTEMPPRIRPVTTSGVNGRPALGISALAPLGSWGREKIVWYMGNGQDLA